MSAHKTSPTNYRDGVGIMLMNAAGQLFLGRRRDDRDHPWQMPQGGLDPGETASQAALREIGEEIGTRKATIIAIQSDWISYDYPNRNSSKHADRFRGQRHRWCLMRFDGTDADVSLGGHDGEFSEWRWCSPAEIAALVTPFKRDAYRQALSWAMPLIADGTTANAASRPLPPSFSVAGLGSV